MNISAVYTQGAEQPKFRSILPDNAAARTENEKKSNTDRLELSEDAEKQRKLDELKQQLADAQEQGDAAGESVKTMSRCLKIAMRIMNGDKVPIKDMKYLQENYPDMFAQAMTLKRINNEPKSYDSVLPDEEENGKNEPPDSSDCAELSGEGDVVCGIAVASDICT